ncbi:MAG TPA: PhzF family phenazine biosynthesis protein [Fimbriimonas sp.]
MVLPIYIVDAFTDTPFRGNPAGVVPLEEPIEEASMQRIAMEVNHPETAFVLESGDAYSLRWFTPEAEVDLCGHATLAAAHILWGTGRLPVTRSAYFDTLSGRLTADRLEKGIRLDFPAEPPVEVPTPPQIRALFGSSIVWTGRNRLDLLVELADECAVRSFTPDIPVLESLGGRGVIITAPATETDFVSRFFAPSVGVDEDPVTGSAHCCLGPYWAKKTGRTELVGYQASARGGLVRVVVRNERVDLIGHAVTMLQGEIVRP